MVKMQINVTFRHIEPSVSLREYAEEKLSRIKKYLKEPIEAHVVLKVEKFRHTAEVSMDANGVRLKGSEETEDMYSAIDMLADTLEAQAKKSKEKASQKKGGAPGRFVADGGLFPQKNSEGVEEDGQPRIIRTEQMFPKPMDIDEAAMQLTLSNGEFMVFTNRRSNRVNVLYRRKDGHYGLIETIS